MQRVLKLQASQTCTILANHKRLWKGLKVEQPLVKVVTMLILQRQNSTVASTLPQRSVVS